MADLYELIKEISINVVEESQPMAVFFGTITNMSPINIFIDSKLTLKPLHISMTDTAKKIDFKTGDKVLLLRMKGGQKYIVIDRV